MAYLKLPTLMLSLVSIFPVTFALSQPTFVIYGYRSELLARLIAYLATLSTIIWVGVVATVMVRLIAHYRYNSVRRVRLAAKKRNVYRQSL